MVLAARGWRHGGHFSETQDNEELPDDDPGIAPKHAGGAAIDEHLKVVERNEFRGRNVSVRTVADRE